MSSEKRAIQFSSVVSFSPLKQGFKQMHKQMLAAFKNWSPIAACAVVVEMGKRLQVETTNNCQTHLKAWE